MYIIINKTAKSIDRIIGDWPDKYLNLMLNKGDKLIVISLYSNTIKVPSSQSVNWDSTIEWKWDEYELPLDLLKG